MTYTLDTITYSSFTVLTIGKASIFLPKKAIASIDLQDNNVTVKFEDGTKQNESLDKSKVKGGARAFPRSRQRDGRRRGY